MMHDRTQKLNNAFGRFTRRAAAVLLSLLTVISALPFVPSQLEAEAAGLTNTFVLAVSTGLVAGKNIQYLCVRYEDSEGVERSELIFPGQDSLQKSFDMASAAGNQSSRRNILKNSVDYQPVSCAQTGGLSQYNTDMYLFKTDYDFKRLVSVDAFARFEAGGKNEMWTLTDLRFYSVEQLYGVKMYGYYSGRWYIDFKGELLAQLKDSELSDGTAELVTNNTSRLFRFGMTKQCDFRLEEPEEQLRQYDSHSQSEFYFRMDIADTFGGGIEAMANLMEDYASYKAELQKMHLPEVLTFSITYEDIYGETRYADLPVITSFAAWLMESNSGASMWRVSGLFQQGDTIMFKGALPDYKNLKKWSITYGSDAEALARVTPVTSGDSQRSRRLSQLENSIIDPTRRDELAISSFSIFREGDVSPRVEMDEASLRCTLDGEPIRYFTANSTAGRVIQYNSGANSFDEIKSPADGGYNLNPAGVAWTYIVELDTDTVQNAGTTDDIYIRLRYLSKNGAEKVSETIDVHKTVSGFLGFWPGSGGDFSYYSGAGMGGKLLVPVTLTDVDYFIGMYLFTGNSSTDEWQMSQIKIYRVDSVSSRHVRWGDVSIGTSRSDRYIYRLFNTDQCVRTYVKQILLHSKNNNIYIPFDESGEIENQEVDWEKTKYSMSYEETKQNFGFTDVRCKYEVQVQVAGNSQSDDANGDSGSTNMFFFQLVFEGGRSAYVLANQQLAADGFRAGQVEKFNIYTNRNYGELSAINIIPDDVSEDKQIFDKLNIQSIDVAFVDPSGVNLIWTVSDVGWIGIDYQDEGLMMDYTGQPGRTEAQLARTYVVSSKSYGINLMFALSTTGYKDNVQFDGKLEARIQYYNSDHVLVPYSLNIAEEIYNYAQRSPADGREKTKIDPSFMLRPGQTDRFEVCLKDVWQLQSITLIASGGSKECTWNLGGVEVYQITEKGALQLNQNGEFQREDKTQLITGSASEAGYSLRIFADGNDHEFPIQFNRSQIEIKSSGDSWEAQIESNPQNYSDSVNIYVYMSSNASPINSYNMSAAVEYQYRTTDQPAQANVRTMAKSTVNGVSMFYYKGLSTVGMTTLHGLALTASSTNNPAANVDYAVVQHMRSGTVVATYRLYFGGQNAMFSKIACSLKNNGQQQASKQRVMLQFSQDTVESELSGNICDVGVSIRYTMKNDVGVSNYFSRTTTLASQGIDRIRPGQTVTLEFEEDFVEEITGITLQSTGNVNAKVDMACAGIYESDSSNEVKCTSWSSFGKSAKITVDRQTLSKSSTPVSPMTFTFTTGQMQANVESGTSAPIKMMVNVTDRSGVEKTLSYPVLGKNLVSGSFATGKTAVVTMLATDIREVRNITLEPYDYDKNNVANWTVDSVQATWTVDGSETTASRLVKENIYEGSPLTVNLSNVIVSLNVIAYNARGSSYAERNTVGGEVDMTILSGETVRITPKVQGTLSGYGSTVRVERVSGDAASAVDCFTVESSGRVTFTPPVNETDAAIRYRITITSEEVPSAFATVTVDVKPVIVPENSTT